MFVYHATKEKFLQNLATSTIETIILESYQNTLHSSVGTSEKRAWKESLRHMGLILRNEAIPVGAMISIEYCLPSTNKRVDFIISGKDSRGHDHAIIVELKQWTEVELTEKDGIVKTYFEHGPTETPHPSYQAWSYADFLRGSSMVVYEEHIELHPCAYLHNYEDDSIITDSSFEKIISDAPLFFKDEIIQLQNFIKQFIAQDDATDIMQRIEAGEWRPSKELGENIAEIIRGNSQFVMLDDQKVVYETVVALEKKQSATVETRLIASLPRATKHVLIVEGGPGTGKSVVAMHLFGHFMQKRYRTEYITKNTTPREVFLNQLTEKVVDKMRLSNYFSGSGSFASVPENSYQALIIDEAHRLTEKSGIFKNIGENQIKELINATPFSVFFIDEDQKVSWDDIGEKEEIRKWGKYFNAEITELSLTSQFRCNGSDGYIAWLDNALQIHETANMSLQGIPYDFKVVETPLELKQLIREQEDEGFLSRLVAGYCWPWVSKKNPKQYDFSFPEYNLFLKWNLDKDRNLWLITPEAREEVGCIHSTQGLEMDYVGVIIGPDLLVREGKVLVDPLKHPSEDRTLSGFRSAVKKNKEMAQEKARRIIKNTYRTLMSRGRKGCYVYCTDEETREYLRKMI
jgi:DUF2075 family protein